MNILISPWSRPLRNGKENPKNYPYWNEVISFLKNYDSHFIVQIGVKDEKRINADNFIFDKPLEIIKELILRCDIWCSVDNFLPHFCNTFNSYGTVIFSISDPNLFGYEKNINILKDRKYLRNNQFSTWEDSIYNIEAFSQPEEVAKIILEKRINLK